MGGSLSVLFQPRLIASVSEQLQVTSAPLSFFFDIRHCGEAPNSQDPSLLEKSLHIWGNEGRFPVGLFIVTYFKLTADWNKLDFPSQGWNSD